MKDFMVEAIDALNKAESQLIVAREALADAGFPPAKIMDLTQLRNQVLAYRKGLGVPMRVQS